MLLLPGILCSVIKGKCKNLVDFITNSAVRCVIMLHLEQVKEDYRRFVFWQWGAGRDKNKERNILGDEIRAGHLYLCNHIYLGSLVISKLVSLITEM